MDEMIYGIKNFFATDELLNNPHMGFTTFQRFNGDKLNDLGMNNGGGWTEGYPIEYQKWDGSLHNENHPDTTIAYWRVYWRFIEPERGQYKWDMIDKALQAAKKRKQSLMLLFAPYGMQKDQDVPDWYRKIIGFEPDVRKEWRTDANNPLYAEAFGGFIKAFAEKYDGHPDLDSIDMGIVGHWGEGGGCGYMTDKALYSITDAYIDNFKKTPLRSLLMDDVRHHDYCREKSRKVGWFAACLGDMGGFGPNWSHMFVAYPESIAAFGLTDSWKTGPVSFEVCWVVNKWLENGWDIDYIIDQSLKWHVSTFNAKSSPIPEVWKSNVERWLKKMGYRFAVRRVSYSSIPKAGGAINIKAWFENIGVAPIYHRYPLAFRLKNLNNKSQRYILKSNADITTWLPGDIIINEDFILPQEITAGKYILQAGIIGKDNDIPEIMLANDGRDSEGWYDMNEIVIN